MCIAVAVKDTVKKEPKDVGKLNTVTKKDDTFEKPDSAPTKEKSKKEVDKVSGNEFKFVAVAIKSGKNKKKSGKAAKKSQQEKKVPKVLKTVSGQLHPKSPRPTEEKLMSMLQQDKSEKLSLSNFGDDNDFAEKHQGWIKDEGTSRQLLDAFASEKRYNTFALEKRPKDSREPVKHQEKDHSEQGHFIVYNQPSARHHRRSSRYDSVGKETDQVGTEVRYSPHSQVPRPARQHNSEEWTTTNVNRLTSPWAQHSTKRYSSNRKHPESTRRYRREHQYGPRREADPEDEYQESEESRYYYRRPKEEQYSFSDDLSEGEEFSRIYSRSPRESLPEGYLSQMNYARRMLGGY